MSPRATRATVSRLPKPTELSRAEREQRGVDARIEVPLEAHAELPEVADRTDPVRILLDQAATRVPELVPIRHGRMLASPFAFFRGAAAVMAADLASTPDAGIQVQACGDAHLANFGVFAAPDRRLVFDVNDFDETLPGPWEWDVKRLAASFEIAARDRGFTGKERRKIVRTCASSYRLSMTGFASASIIDVWYARLDIETTLARLRDEVKSSEAAAIDRRVLKAKSRDNLAAFDKLTRVVDGRRRFISTPPLIVPLDELVGADTLTEAFRRLQTTYRRTLAEDRRRLLGQFSLTDIARKVVGVGSVGTRAWVLLLMGPDGEPLILQAKEAQPSVLEPYRGRSAYSQHGQRVVEGQRLMQATSDIFLGWDRIVGLDGQTRDFYVRQLWDGKVSPLVESMPPSRMRRYAQLCGWTLARAHARSGDRMAIAAYLGADDTFDRAISSFSAAYADRNAADHALLQRAVQDGRVSAEPGV